MKIKAFVITILAILLVGLFCSYIAISQIRPVKVDLARINEIVQDTEKDIQIKNVIESEGYLLVKNNTPITLYFIIGFSFIFLIITVSAYYLYLNKTIFKPFNKLQEFARFIASGNLEAPLTMDKHNIFGAFTESFDIMREELKKAKESENRANKAKKELIAGLSHDIKTPVASIRAISELVLATTNDSGIKSRISTIYDKSEQIDRLITDMFNATLEELGELSVCITEEYSSVLEGIFKRSDYLGKAKLGNIPDCIINIDKLRFSQVIDNVLTNSYKYAGTDIEINFNLSDSHLEIDIADFGGGVDEDDLTLLFNKFFRGKNVGSNSGSGLGLYISKFLMEKQNGDIVCYNKQNGFAVRLFIEIP